MIKKLLSPFKHFAWFKRLNAKITYEFLAKNVPAANWHFMNYGYVPNPSEKNVEVPAESVGQQYALKMYHYLASKTVIEGKNVLEVGSGRGGGARHIASYFKPASYTGMDLAQNAVDLATKLHPIPNLKFIQGSAEAIPLPDESVDVIVNVESSHAYGSVEKFLGEVYRVLKRGGYFLTVDFRDAELVPAWKEQIKKSGLQLIEEEDITANVVEAMEVDDSNKRERIKQLNVAPKWQKLFAEFAGVVGSGIHTKLKNRTRLYYRFVLRKN
jgi:cyclopropane fatty-acyl-phospholipid synthase-like methyltransferase